MTVRLARWPMSTKVEISGFFGNILVIFQVFPEIFPGLFSYTLDNIHDLHHSLGHIPGKTGHFLFVYILATTENLKSSARLETILKTSYLK